MQGQEFRKIRKALGLTQEELANIMGLYQGNVSRIENGKRNPTKQQVAFITMLHKQKREEPREKGWGYREGVVKGQRG